MNSGGAVRKSRPPHRGANGCTFEFARDFVQGRLKGFAKDMRICLTGVPRDDGRRGKTHAYFPALMSCCGTLEYLAMLYLGSAGLSLGHKRIAEYTARYMGDDYDSDTIRVLFEAFRNNIAHRGIASGVWVDLHPQHLGRRITWRVKAHSAAPALGLVEENHSLKFDSPWPTPHTHRMHIRLGRLWRDIHDSGQRYLADLAESEQLQRKFCVCIRQWYPI